VPNSLTGLFWLNKVAFLPYHTPVHLPLITVELDQQSYLREIPAFILKFRQRISATLHPYRYPHHTPSTMPTSSRIWQRSLDLSQVNPFASSATSNAIRSSRS
jgi:hypothetical protein